VQTRLNDATGGACCRHELLGRARCPIPAPFIINEVSGAWTAWEPYDNLVQAPRHDRGGSEGGRDTLEGLEENSAGKKSSNPGPNTRRHGPWHGGSATCGVFLFALFRLDREKQPPKNRRVRRGVYAQTNTTPGKKALGAANRGTSSSSPSSYLGDVEGSWKNRRCNRKNPSEKPFAVHTSRGCHRGRGATSPGPPVGWSSAPSPGPTAHGSTRVVGPPPGPGPCGESSQTGGTRPRLGTSFLQASSPGGSYLGAKRSRGRTFTGLAA